MIHTTITTMINTTIICIINTITINVNVNDHGINTIMTTPPLSFFPQADRTTLGADDGIGVATALALLDAPPTATLPPLEVCYGVCVCVYDVCVCVYDVYTGCCNTHYMTFVCMQEYCMYSHEAHTPHPTPTQIHTHMYTHAHKNQIK